MKITAISDTHGFHEQVNLGSGDVLIHAGDCTDGTLESLIDFCKWFGEQDFEYKILVAGNHDFPFENDVFESRRATELNRIIYLQDSSININGFLFYGTPWTPVFGQWAFMMEDKYLETWFSKIPRNVDVLVSHGPPHGILDKAVSFGGVRAGSHFLKREVLNKEPRVHIFGHIHEGYGKWKKGNTIFANVSMCSVRYSIENPPTVFDIS